MEVGKLGVFLVAVLLFHHLLLPVNSEPQRNPLLTASAPPVLPSSAAVRVGVIRYGGGHGGGHSGGHGGGHGGGHIGGGHSSSRGMTHGDNSNSAYGHGDVIPLYAAGGTSHRSNNYNHRHGTSNGNQKNVCFYQYLLFLISIAFLF